MHARVRADGAVAVVCDECVAKKEEIRWACDGSPTDGKRVPVDRLQGEPKHDLSKHPELLHQRFCEGHLYCPNCKGVRCVKVLVWVVEKKHRDVRPKQVVCLTCRNAFTVEKKK